MALEASLPDLTASYAGAAIAAAGSVTLRQERRLRTPSSFCNHLQAIPAPDADDLRGECGWRKTGLWLFDSFDSILVWAIGDKAAATGHCYVSSSSASHYCTSPFLVYSSGSSAAHRVEASCAA